ncbi:hypothetical protein ACLIA0_10095 [Bacillaceae bacterium W0354]
MFVGKTLAAIISSIVFVFILPFEINHVVYVFLYSFPIFLVAGYLVSVVADCLIKKVNIMNSVHKYAFQFILYVLAGLFVVSLLAVMSGSVSEVTLPALALLGILPGLIYFHIYFVLTYLFSRISNS